MKNFILRTLTGAGIVTLILAGILINRFTFMIVFLAILISGMLEFYSIFKKNGKNPQIIPGIIIGVMVFGLNYFIATGFLRPQTMTIIFPCLLYIVIAELYRKQLFPFENIAITVFGIIYIAIPISLLWYFGFRININYYNPNLILGYFIFIWTYDTMAYLIGMAFGRKKLFERISPKKSWEGAVGGFIFCILIAFLLSVFNKNLSLLQWTIFGSLIAIFGTFGDLAESMLKRSYEIKDSGSILPGHGGILDRFDALFLAVPAIYLYLLFI